MIYKTKGNLVRIFYLTISLIVWLLSFGGRFFSTNKIILCYHGINNSDTGTFLKQMQVVANRRQALALPSVEVTFDDAFENLHRNAIPITNELQIPISIYVITNYMGEVPNWPSNNFRNDKFEQLMSQEQIQSLSSSPLVSIGTHTHTHSKLTTLKNNDIYQEIKQSKKILEDLIGKKVTSIAFPNGAFNSEILSIAKSCGLTQFLTLEEKMNAQNQTHGKMGRFLMEPNTWPIEFRLTIDGAYFWLFYFRQLIKGLKKLIGKVQ